MFANLLYYSNDLSGRSLSQQGDKQICIKARKKKNNAGVTPKLKYWLITTSRGKTLCSDIYLDMKENSVPRAQMRWTQSKYLNTQRRVKPIVDSKHALSERIIPRCLRKGKKFLWSCQENRPRWLSWRKTLLWQRSDWAPCLSRHRFGVACSSMRTVWSKIIFINRGCQTNICR